MSRSDLFAYLAAFVTIMLAIALTDMVHSLHRLLRAGRRVKWDVLTPILAAILFLSVVSHFFSLWDEARFERLSFYGLLAFMAMPTIVTLAAFAVLPDEVGADGIDLKQFYFDNRRYVAVLLALNGVGDSIRIARWATINDAWGDPHFWWRVGPLLGVSFAALGVMYYSPRWRDQLIALLALLAVVHFGYVNWSISSVAAPS